jgi:hypothetical protein
VLTEPKGCVGGDVDVDVDVDVDADVLVFVFVFCVVFADGEVPLVLY